MRWSPGHEPGGFWRETTSSTDPLGCDLNEVVSARSGNASMLVYHAWTDGAVGYDEGYRNLYVTVLLFENGQPVTPRLGA